MIKVFFLSIWYQFKMSLRIKESVFFTMVFPVFIFILFGKIWGDMDPDYIPFILTGMLGITFVSDGLFGIGGVIKQYYAYHLIKFLRNLPLSVYVHFLGLALSRGLVMSLLVFILVGLARFVFSYNIPLDQVGYCLLGVLLGFPVFGFIGLILSFLSKKEDTGNGILMVALYALGFISDAFYPISQMNELIGKFLYISPLTHLLKLMRGEPSHAFVLILWLLALMIIFSFVFNKRQIQR